MVLDMQTTTAAPVVTTSVQLQPVRRPRTALQRETSRRNGRLSRGPRTAEVRPLVRTNPLVRGMIVRTISSTSTAVTDRPTFDRLLVALAEDFAPQTQLELVMVETLAFDTLRLQRILTMIDGTLDATQPLPVMVNGIPDMERAEQAQSRRPVNWPGEPDKLNMVIDVLAQMVAGHEAGTPSPTLTAEMANEVGQRLWRQINRAQTVADECRARMNQIEEDERDDDPPLSERVKQDYREEVAEIREKLAKLDALHQADRPPHARASPPAGVAGGIGGPTRAGQAHASIFMERLRETYQSAKEQRERTIWWRNDMEAGAKEALLRACANPKLGTQMETLQRYEAWCRQAIDRDLATLKSLQARRPSSAGRVRSSRSVTVTREIRATESVEHTDGQLAGAQDGR